MRYVTDKKYGRLTVRDELFHDAAAFNMNDADGAIFFARELEHIKAQALDTKYAELPYRRVLVVSNEAGEGADFITQTVFDQTGIAKIIGAYSKDLPRADVGGKEFGVPVRESGISFAFTIMEIAKAQRAGKPLQARKLQAAIRATEQLQNDVAFFGDATYGLIGLFTHPNIPETAAPSGVWASATPDQILDDLFNATDDIFTDSFMIEKPKKLYMDPANYKLIARTPRSATATSDKSILEYFVEKSMFIGSVEDVEPLNECSAAVRNAKGLSNENVLITGDFSAENITFEEPSPLKFLPEQRQGLEILIPGTSSFAGVLVNFPLAFSIYTGI